MSDEFTEWDGNVGAHDSSTIADTRLSATALQTWASCPARYFFKQVLRVREHDDVGDVDELEARHRGSLVHLVLERLGREHLERYRAHADQLQLEIEQVPWTETAREVVEQVTDEVLDEFEGVGERALRDPLGRREAHLSRRDSHPRQGLPRARLLAVEHQFGTDERAILAQPRERPDAPLQGNDRPRRSVAASGCG